MDTKAANDKSIWKEELRDVNQAIAYRVRDIVKETGFTYERFASEICEIDRVSLANMLAGRHRIDTRVLRNIVHNIASHPDLTENMSSIVSKVTYEFLIEGKLKDDSKLKELEKITADYQNLKDKFIALTLAAS